MTIETTVAKSANDLRVEEQARHLHFDEKLTGNQTGTIAVGPTSFVYQSINGSGTLPRAFRVRKCGEVYPEYVAFSVFDDATSRFYETLVHWTLAFDYMRAHGIWRHSISKVYWPGGKWSFASFKLHVTEDSLSIADGLLRELPKPKGGVQ